MTTADGRSPGLRVVTFRRLPRTEIPSGIGRKIHRLQLRGQPRNWGTFPAPHSLLIPKTGTVENYGRSLSKTESIPSGPACGPHWTSASFLSHEQYRSERVVRYGLTVRGRSMSVQTVIGRKRGGRAPPHWRDGRACRPRRAAGADLARHRAGAAVAAGGHGSAARRRQRRVAGDRAGNPPAADHSGAGDRRDPGIVRRVAAGPAAQSAGLALAVRRAAIGGLRRGAGDRAGAGRCALLCAAGRGDHGRVRLGVRAADDRRPQCRAVDPDPGGACDFVLWRARRRRW